METGGREKRITDTIFGKLAAALLAVVWCVSMGAVDSNAYSVWPCLMALAVVSLLFIVGMLVGGKTIRMPLPGWCSLFIGGYFFIRCLYSYSVVEAWQESSLIVSCCVFYVAGIYGAQSRHARMLFALVFVAAFLNVLYLVVRPGEYNMLLTGRPEFGLSGPNHSPVTLFVYKNFAGAFQMIIGGVLIGMMLWFPLSRGKRFMCGGLAVAAVIGAFFCGTRAAYLLLIVLLYAVCYLQLMVELFTRDKVRTVTWLGSVVLAVVFVVEVLNLIFGDGMNRMADVDSHLRFDIWKEVYKIACSAPLCGYGAMASHWEIIGQFKYVSTPNMAHNEYLQVWCDYGISGLVAMVAVLVLHAVTGIRVLCSEDVCPVRRGLVAIALVVVISWSTVALTDFVWHSYAIATMCAYCCGALASPYQAKEKMQKRGREGNGGASARKQGFCGRLLMALLAGGVVVFALWQYPHLSEAWWKQWYFNELSLSGTDVRAEKRLRLLERIIASYPSSEVVDYYFMLPHYGGLRPQSETMLRTALEANPRQGYTLTMLVTLLGREHRYEEAELLMRRYYPQEGLPNKGVCNWPFFYYYNLLRWSHWLMAHGQESQGMSVAEYALNMEKIPGVQLMERYCRPGELPWKKYEGIVTASQVKNFSAVVARRLRVLRKVGVQQDDTWRRPMEPHGKSALYPRFGMPGKEGDSVNQKDE